MSDSSRCVYVPICVCAYMCNMVCGCASVCVCVCSDKVCADVPVCVYVVCVWW